MEEYERWPTVPDLDTPCAGVDIELIHRRLTVRMLFSEMVGRPERDLVFLFEDSIVVTSFDEFQHPWNFQTGGPVPKLEGKWAQYAYPVLVVRGSQWAQRIKDTHGLRGEGLIHLRMVTLDHTVDVLGRGPASALWQDALPYPAS
jgi:hypothetical protein